MRQLVRYDLDDLPGPSKMSGNRSPAHSPPSKKRKQSHQRTQHIQHWDDPGSSREEVVYDEQEEDVREDSYTYEEEEAGAGLPGEVGEEESRELAYEEIWDDSALIDAWNSATAEYEAYHGNSKDWKTDPVKKSPLWYNKPYTGPKSQETTAKGKATSQKNTLHLANEEGDTAPLDFNTFVPMHDPSLSAPSEPPPATQSNPAFFIPSPSTTMVSRDEAFNNALSAMYWSGYWTAIYHAQSQSSGKEVLAEDDQDGEGEEEEEVEGNEDDLVPAQR